jgi:hypothetical protein
MTDPTHELVSPAGTDNDDLAGDAATFVDNPSVSDNPHQEAPATDNRLRPEDGPQDDVDVEEETS